VKLKNKPELRVANFGSLIIGEERDVLISDVNFATVGMIEQPEEIEQRAFTATGRADDRIGFAWVQIDGDGLKHLDSALFLTQIAD
jgi:hypothetical protein